MMAVTLTHSLRDYYHSSEVLLRIGAPFKRISLEVNAFAESQSSIKHQMSASYVLAMEIQSLFGVQSYNECNIDMISKPRSDHVTMATKHLLIS